MNLKFLTNYSIISFKFSAQIKPEIISELSDKKWQIRGEALQKVKDHLKMGYTT